MRLERAQLMSISKGQGRRWQEKTKGARGTTGLGENSLTLNPFRTRTQHGRTHMARRRRLQSLTNCSDDSKPYMILVAHIKGFQNLIGFAIIRANGE